jgi:hypothetical protein
VLFWFPVWEFASNPKGVVSRRPVRGAMVISRSRVVNVSKVRVNNLMGQAFIFNRDAPFGGPEDIDKKSASRSSTFRWGSIFQHGGDAPFGGSDEIYL